MRSRKSSDVRLLRYSIPFSALIDLSSFEVFRFFDTAVRPLDHDAISLIAPSQAECKRQFRLGKIAGAAFYHVGLNNSSEFEAHDGADGVAIGLRASQVEADAAIRGLKIAGCA